MSKFKNATRTNLRDWLASSLNQWLNEVQEHDDQLAMWLHENLANQMAAQCITLLDACRDSQNFTREQER